MLQQPHRLALLQLHNHVTQYGAYRIEPFIRLTNIIQAHSTLR